jgi:hypothetical protein
MQSVTDAICAICISNCVHPHSYSLSSKCEWICPIQNTAVLFRTLSSNGKSALIFQRTSTILQQKTKLSSLQSLSLSSHDSLLLLPLATTVLLLAQPSTHTAPNTVPPNKLRLEIKVTRSFGMWRSWKQEGHCHDFSSDSPQQACSKLCVVQATWAEFGLHVGIMN